jgi:hypothetical protein
MDKANFKACEALDEKSVGKSMHFINLNDLRLANAYTKSIF